MADGFTPGTVTGLYREDVEDNPNAPEFAVTSDVQREVVSQLTVANNVDDSYEARVRDDDSVASPIN